MNISTTRGTAADTSSIIPLPTVYRGVHDGRLLELQVTWARVHPTLHYLRIDGAAVFAHESPGHGGSALSYALGSGHGNRSLDVRRGDETLMRIWLSSRAVGMHGEVYIENDWGGRGGVLVPEDGSASQRFDDSLAAHPLRFTAKRGAAAAVAAAVPLWGVDLLPQGLVAPARERAMEATSPVLGPVKGLLDAAAAVAGGVFEALLGWVPGALEAAFGWVPALLATETGQLALALLGVLATAALSYRTASRRGAQLAAAREALRELENGEAFAHGFAGTREEGTGAADVSAAAGRTSRGSTRPSWALPAAPAPRFP